MKPLRLVPYVLLLVLCPLAVAAISQETPAGQKAAAGKEAVRGSLVEDRAARKLLEAGDARFDTDEFAKAIEVWQSVIERYPRSKVRLEAHLRLGNYLLDRERAYDRARVHFEAVAGEENKDQEQRALATLKMGQCFYEAGNYGKSFKVMRDVIEQFPVSPQVNQAYYYIGLGHFKLGHYSRAISALEKVGTALVNEAGKVEKVEAGKRLFVKIEDADLAALSADQIIQIRCETTKGDVETVKCLAVGHNVRVVLGSIITALGKPLPNNGTLEVQGGDKVKVTYVDQHTADRQFDQPVLKEIQVVGDALVDITDGAFSESLRGAVLGRPINLQITDADFDLTDGADTLKAVVEIYREKTQTEIEAEQNDAATKAAAKPAEGVAAPAVDAESLEAVKIDPLKKIDSLAVTLTEVKIARQNEARQAEQDAAGEKAIGDKNDAKQPAKPKADKPAGGPPAEATLKAKAQVVAQKSASPDAQGAAVVAKAGEKPEAPKDKDAAAEEKPLAAEPIDDGTIHSGVFRFTLSLVKDEKVVAGDELLQALPNDLVRVTFIDERNSGDAVRTVSATARCVEGNLGGVRVTRAQISDQELRIQTQLKTASALTNIGNRYKEFGLKKNADAKYAQALKVCEEITEDATRLGGRLLEETYVQLWHIYYEMDQLDLAAAMCQRLQREFPNSGFVDDALLQLADVVRKQGDLQHAISIYSRLVDMQTSQLRGEAQFGVAECYEEMAKKTTGPGSAQLYDRSFQEYKKVFDSFPESGRVGEAVAKMANYYYQQKDYARAIDIFESVLANQPDAKFLDVILFNYGRCLYRLERKTDARRQFDQLIADFPESPLAADAKRISEALAKSSSGAAGESN